MNDDLLDNDNHQAEGLPQMLNVLTILTFIGSGLSLLSNVWSFFTIEETRAAMDLVDEAREDAGTEIDNPLVESMMSGAQTVMENAPTLYTTAIIVSILCIVGALQMRKLKKNGFYIYTAACILGLVIPMAIVGFGFMGAAVLAGGFFSILFIILYSVNLKHMH